MKKLFFISVSVILVSFACQKEVITKNVPVQENEATASTRWISTTLDNVDLSGCDNGATGGGITDPNNDPDLNKKKVTRN
ncbi:MAG TPA: hypothetical protein PLP27_04240 [Crocinitomicaceae bacterium]|jgi:hypothetical protein|nr:hypothetical protein [Crocinitomicaceae bacterium]